MSPYDVPEPHGLRAEQPSAETSETPVTTASSTRTTKIVIGALVAATGTMWMAGCLLVLLLVSGLPQRAFHAGERMVSAAFAPDQTTTVANGSWLEQKRIEAMTAELTREATRAQAEAERLAKERAAAARARAPVRNGPITLERPTDRHTDRDDDRSSRRRDDDDRTSRRGDDDRVLRRTN